MATHAVKVHLVDSTDSVENDGHIASQSNRSLEGGNAESCEAMGQGTVVLRYK